MNKDKLIPYLDGQENACPEDPHDNRDLSYDAMAVGAPISIDWKKGFDIRKVIGGDIKIKNQYKSLSCVGQGWAYYIWVKQVIEMITKYGMDLTQLEVAHKDEVDEVSAKAIYSQIFIAATGGAYIRSGAKLLVNWGSLFEKIIPSINQSTNITEEDFMRDKTWINEQMNELANILQGKEYAVITASDNMDLFAQAILQNHGVVGGVCGQNGRGWNTENPLPPIENKPVWRHCLYYGAFGTDEKGRFIATPNSWGNGFKKVNKESVPWFDVGEGWQILRKDYFNSKWQFNPWTFQDKVNIKKMNTNVKIIKDANSPAVGVWLPATSEEALRSYCINFGIKFPEKGIDGAIDWDKFIDGELNLK